jgi:hypothetical protein
MGGWRVATRPAALERGSALLVVLLTLAFVTALCLASAMVATGETTISASFALQAELGYAAAAATDVSRVGACAPDFVASGAGFSDGTTTPRLSDGTILDLPAESVRRQAESDRRFPAGPDRPVWRLVAHGPITTVVPAAVPQPSPYVAVWVADDPADGDGDPMRDSDGRFLLLGAAFGRKGTLRLVESGVHCDPPQPQLAAPLLYRLDLR